MNTVQTSLDVTNYFDVKGQAIVALIQQYVPGLQPYYGFRSMGDNDLSYPHASIEPAMQDARMITLGKFHLKLTFNIFVFVKDNDPANVTSLICHAMESLKKLFSNNALGDLSTTFTNRFKAYSGYWIDSEMGSIEISRMYVNSVQDDSSRYLRAGLMRLTVEDVVVM